MQGSEEPVVDDIIREKRLNWWGQAVRMEGPPFSKIQCASDPRAGECLGENPRSGKNPLYRGRDWTSSQEPSGCGTSKEVAQLLLTAEMGGSSGRPTPGRCWPQDVRNDLEQSGLFTKETLSDPAALCRPKRKWSDLNTLVINKLQESKNEGKEGGEQCECCGKFYRQISRQMQEKELEEELNEHQSAYRPNQNKRQRMERELEKTVALARLRWWGHIRGCRK